MDFICKEPNCNYSSNIKDEFISHVKCAHGLKIDQYLKFNLNKRDLLTKEVIEFKSFEQYLLSDFINKIGFKKGKKRSFILTISL